MQVTIQVNSDSGLRLMLENLHIKVEFLRYFLYNYYIANE